FFSYLGVREFFSRAYPYTTIQDTINTKDGIQLSFPEGGAIPQFMGNFYPSNIPWPSKDPCQDKTDPSCPAYWWSQMQDPSSPYYDQEVTRCSAGNPCQLPLFGQTGNPTGDQINSIWSSELATLSGGALKVSPVDLNFVDIVNAQSSVAGSNPLPLYGLGWAPDYPDPTDYVVPLYASNSTYTAGDAVAQSLEQTQFAQGCAYGPKDFQHWSNVTAIPQSCQGVAYRALNAALGTAAYEANLTKRIQYYDQAEMIAYNLCLYLYSGQGNAIPNFSSWVDINSVNTNVMTGGDATWYSLTGNGVQYSGST
ncbi:MAG TPA: hypothetical protein VGS18_01530, partial [Thermoplasmata archaeon]|nr:hypothetical protein [Thermoplasmata archaeon]